MVYSTAAEEVTACVWVTAHVRVHRDAVVLDATFRMFFTVCTKADKNVASAPPHP